MSQQFQHAFGRELAALRQAEFEAEARRGNLVRLLRRARRARYAPAADTAAPPVPSASARCAADVG